jgi:hypothetical protein
LDLVVAEGDESQDVNISVASSVGPESEAGGVAPIPQPEAIRRLFSQLDIRSREDGGVRLEAPPEAAAGLAALFEGLAGLLRQSSARLTLRAGCQYTQSNTPDCTRPCSYNNRSITIKTRARLALFSVASDC